MSGVSLYIEGVKIDLSDKEGINIKLNSQDINDISKVNAGYSKDFSVMATKNNNKFFKHYYNADITGGFDARVKKSGTIYLDDLFFISGKIRLTTTVLENNLIVSYRIQFEGDVVNVKDVLGDKKLKDLDLSMFNHAYNSANVLQGLTDSLFSGSVIYPLISPVNRYLFDSSDSFVNTENTKNIHYNSSEAEQSINYNELKPAIRVADLIFQIEQQNGFNFVGDFFTRDYYNNLFMWFSNKDGLIDVTANTQQNLIVYDNPSQFFLNNTTIDIDLVKNSSSDTYIGLTLSNTITISAGFESIPYSYVITVDNVEVYRQNNITGTQTIEYFINSSTSTGLINFYIETNTTLSYISDLTQIANFLSIGNIVVENSNSLLTNIASQVILNQQAPDLKQIDLITGIIKMFNIALTAQQNGDILWQTLPDYYSSGKELIDFDKYINIDKTNISRGKLNNEFAFNYEEPTTILAEQFKNNNPDAYGDLTEELKDDNGDLLDGDKLEIKLPFENMVNERLRDLANNTNISFQYGYSVDKSLNPVNPKPVLFYNNRNTSPGIGFKDDANVTFELDTNALLNTPNNTNSLTDNTKQSINFSSELSTYNFGIMNNTLYNAFYSDYISDLFSPQRRVYIFDAVIPNFILANINLNDRLIIQNKRYIINSINSNLTTGKTKLELINDIYEAGELIGNRFFAEPDFFVIDANSQDIQSTIFNNGQTTLSLVDEGDGIFGSIVGANPFNGVTTKTFEIQENTTTQQRVMSVLCDNGTETFKITILQNGSDVEVITFDSTTITFDNTNITFDNE